MRERAIEKINLKQSQVMNFLNVEPGYFFVRRSKTQQYTSNKFRKYKGKGSLMEFYKLNTDSKWVSFAMITTICMTLLVSVTKYMLKTSCLFIFNINKFKLCRLLTIL